MPLDTEFLNSYDAIPRSDVYILGDGSGTTLDFASGWFATVLDVKNAKQYTHLGGSNHGTNNYAELYPYIHALWHYQAIGGSGKTVTIISDSELTVKCGRREYDRRANLPLWAAMDYLGGVFTLRWHHLPRNNTNYHQLADEMAGKVRLTLSKIEINHA